MKHRSFFWSVFFVAGLLVCTVTLGVTGTLAALLRDDLDAGAYALLRGLCVVAFAGLCGFALGVTQVATASAQQLHGQKGHGVAFALAISCAVLCALVSVFGVHIGGQFLNGDVRVQLDEGTLLVCGIGLAFVKPAMGYVTEACRAVNAAAVLAYETAQAEADRLASERSAQADREASLERARIAAASQPAQLPAPEPAKVESLADHRAKKAPAKKPAAGSKPSGQAGRRVAAAAMAGASALVGNGLLTDAHASQPAAVEQAAERPAEARRPSLDEIESARLALARQNAARVATGLDPLPISQRSVARQIGVRRCDVQAVWPAGEPLHLEV